MNQRSRYSLTRSTTFAALILISLATHALPVVAQPGTPYRFVPEGELPQDIKRARIFQHAIAFVRAYDEEDAAYALCLGTFIDAETIALPWEGFERAARITVQPLCCDEFDVNGIVAGGIDPSVLLVAIDFDGHHAGLGVKPVTLSPDAADATTRDKVWSAFRPMAMGTNPSDGYVSAAMTPEPIASIDDLVGLGRVMQVPWSGEILLGGSPIFDDQDNMIALCIAGGSRNTSFAVPADRIKALTRHDPIAPSEYASRTLSVPEQAERKAGMGRLHQQQGDKVSAIEPLRAAAALDDRQWRARFQLGVCLDETGKPAEALTALYESVQIEPHFAESLYSLAIVAYNVGALPAATHYYKRALEIAPSYASAHMNLASTYANSARLKLAAHHAMVATKLSPERTDYAQANQQIQASLKDTVAKRDALVEKTALPGAIATDYILLGYYEFSLDAYEPCISALNKGIALEPEPADAAFADALRLRALIELDRHGEARELAQTSAEAYPDFTQEDDPVRFVEWLIKVDEGDLTDLIAELKAMPGGG